MNALNDEQLDAELTRLPFPDRDRAFDDGLLHRYRRGELDDAGTARVEQLLLQSPNARSVLLESAHPVDDALIGRLESVVVPPSDEGTIATRVGLVAVAIALAASIVAWVMRPATPDFAPSMDITLMAGHVLDERDGDTRPVETPVFVPQARARFVLTALPGSIGGIPEVAAYRADENGRMVAVDAEVTRGETGVSVEGRAGALFGEAAGTRDLHLVLSAPGRTPSHARRTVDRARADACDTCWMTITAEIRP